jgi:hypothetical protein
MLLHFNASSVSLCFLPTCLNFLMLDVPVHSPFRPLRRCEFRPIPQPPLDLLDAESPLLLQNAHHPCRKSHLPPKGKDSIQPPSRTHK